MNTTRPDPFRVLRLERVEYRSEIKIEPSELRIGKLLDQDGLVVHQLSAFLYAQKRQKFVIEKVPATWWDHLKTVLPGWVVRNFFAPPKMRSVFVDARVVYDRTMIEAPALSPYIEILVDEQPRFFAKDDALDRSVKGE